jgi:hypothetical protein
MKEQKSASRDRRELLLFPDCSFDQNRGVGNSEPNRGRIGTDAEAPPKQIESAARGAFQISNLFPVCRVG